MLLIISGKQGSGKTTTSNFVKNRMSDLGYKVHTIKFADAIYEMHDSVREYLKNNQSQDLGEFASDVSDIITRSMTKYGYNLTEEQVNQVYTYMFNWSDRYLNNPESIPEKKDGDLLQWLGTELGRSIDENIWSNIGKIKAHSAIQDAAGKNVLVVIDDCRFENEFNALEDSLRVRIECPEEIRKQRAEYWRENTSHPSEVGLDSYAADGKFDMYFHSDEQSIDHIGTMIISKLRKNNWKDKRSCH